MRRFTQLFAELDASNKTLDKVGALRRYFAEVPSADAAWALWFLLGRRFPALVKSGRLRQWAGDLSGLPDWLVGACYERVGDSAETVALLISSAGEPLDQPLCRFIEDRLLPLRDWDEAIQFQLLRETWGILDRAQALVFNKLLTGNFRLGASRALVVRALAENCGVEKQVMAHRLMGHWDPTARFFEGLCQPENAEVDFSRPYPFYLASPLDDPSGLGEAGQWFAEWKWDGIRAQLLKRRGEIFLWSRGEELVSAQYPEIVAAAARLPNGTVLDGELLCWREGRPMSFNALQTRISRKRLTTEVLRDCPVSFVAYDCLEFQGQDVRDWPQDRRRETLEAMVVGLLQEPRRIELSEVLRGASWAELRERWETSRSRGVEGLMLKHREGPYRAGRVRGQWWKWKVAPYTADLVMIQAQSGTGRRASLFTDYTFAAWQGGQLVPVAKAYSGLSDAEIRRVDTWVKRHTLSRHGPVRVVPPVHVFEIAFEGLRESARHRSGIALRFPRIHRWRTDKKPEEADTVEALKGLVRTEEP